MWIFQDTRKRSFINDFSIYVAVPLNYELFNMKNVRQKQSPCKIPADFRQATDEPCLTPKKKEIKAKISFENSILIQLYKKQGNVWFQVMIVQLYKKRGNIWFQVMIAESWGNNRVPKNW